MIRAETRYARFEGVTAPRDVQLHPHPLVVAPTQQPPASPLACNFHPIIAGDLKRQLRKAREREARFDERVIWKYFSQIAGTCPYITLGCLDWT